MTACFSGFVAIFLVSKWPSRKPRQLPMMAVGKDGEILPVAGEVIGKAGSGERVSQGISGEARHTLLAVGYDRSARCLHALDRVEASGVLLPRQLLLCDLASVIIGISGLKLGWSWKRSDGFGWDRHAFLLCFDIFLADRPAHTLA